MVTDTDQQGDGWIPHQGMRVPEIRPLVCDLLLRSGDVVEYEDSEPYWPHWHWSSGSTDPDDIIAFRMDPV
jgi:hypothetical protein